MFGQEIKDGIPVPEIAKGPPFPAIARLREKRAGHIPVAVIMRDCLALCIASVNLE